MADGIVNSSREEKEYLPWAIHDPGTFHDSGQSFGLYNLIQSTTSYRTGSSAGSSVEPVSSDTPATEAGVFQYLRKDEIYGNDNPNGLNDTGHEFTTEKTFLADLSHRSVFIASGPASYEGPLIPADSGAAPPFGRTAGSFDNQSYYGPKAISATIPTNPAAHVAESLGEILEHSFFPSLTGVQFRTLQEMLDSISKGYVNFEFGWKPFKSDVQQILKAVVGSSTVMQQFKRDAGKPVRRSYDFPVENSVTVEGPQPNSLVTPQDGHGGSPNSQDYAHSVGVGTIGGQHKVTVSTEKKIWFRGAYMYFTPENDIFASALTTRAAALNHLLGIDLTPIDVWNLAPWSWLVDWRYNVGANIKNASLLSSDGLVIKYGYLMCTTSTSTEHTLDGWRDVNGDTYGTIKASFVSIKKERHRASPYGFGINPASLSDTQWAILAALGFLKAAKVFR